MDLGAINVNLHLFGPAIPPLRVYFYLLLPLAGLSNNRFGSHACLGRGVGYTT